MFFRREFSKKKMCAFGIFFNEGKKNQTPNSTVGTLPHQESRNWQPKFNPSPIFSLIYWKKKINFIKTSLSLFESWGIMAAIGSGCSSNSSFIYHHRHLDGPSISSSSFKNPSLAFDLRSKRAVPISRPRTVIAKLSSSSSVGQEDPKAADDETRPLKVLPWHSSLLRGFKAPAMISFSF